MKQKSKVKRVHVSYPEVLDEGLHEIASQTDKGTLSEVFREALKLYYLVHEEHKKGSDLLIRKQDGEIERVRLFL